MIVLVGSGEYLPPIEPVDRFLLGQLHTPARVVCLPTAAGSEGAETIKYWSDLGVAHFARLGVQVEALPVIDRNSANDPALAERIRAANFVYLSGGQPNYLFNTLNLSLAWEAIQHSLVQGGILAGCSAGAMILGKQFFGFPGWKWKAGFDMVPFQIIPHYDEISTYMVQGIRALIGRRKTLMGIDGSTALIVNNSTYHVMGRGGVTVLQPGEQTRYTDGQVIPQQRL